MASIYETDLYAPARNDYVKNEIVLCGECLNGDPATASSRFYYNLGYSVAVGGNTNGLRPEAGGGDAYWGGYTTYDTKTIPHFFWIADYGAGISSEPKVNVLQFGDGYEQRTPESISADLLKLDLTFDNRGEKEAAAIAHFLHVRGAKEAFAFMPPSPYGSMKKFVCRSWDVTMTFNNNFSVKASFEEVVS